MIVKVQLSLFSSNGLKRAFIYDKSRENEYETEDDDEVTFIESILDGKPKAYFNADIVNKQFVINEQVEAQDW